MHAQRFATVVLFVLILLSFILLSIVMLSNQTEDVSNANPPLECEDTDEAPEQTPQGTAVEDGELPPCGFVSEPANGEPNPKYDGSEPSSSS